MSSRTICFLTPLNTLRYYYKVVFLFQSFLVITVHQKTLNKNKNSCLEKSWDERQNKDDFHSIVTSNHRISTICKQTMSVLQIKMVYENIEKVKRETRDWFNEFIPGSHLSAFRYIVRHNVYYPTLGISSTVRFIVGRYVY